MCAKYFFSATLTFKSTTKFGHLGIVITIGINKHEVWLKITILRLFVATAANISDAVLHYYHWSSVSGLGMGDCSPLTL